MVEFSHIKILLSCLACNIEIGMLSISNLQSELHWEYFF